MSQKQETSGKALLCELQATGRYLFHGSGARVEQFEPRQAKNFVAGQKLDDDRPGVHASPLAEIAIFMGLIHRGNCPKGSFCRYELVEGEDVKVLFEATQKTLDQLCHPEAFLPAGHSVSGHVYVFDKTPFTARDAIESICYEPVRPEKVVAVGYADLPEIRIIPEP